MRCVTKTKCVRCRANTYTDRHTIQMERGVSSISTRVPLCVSPCFGSACAGVLAMHQLSPLQNLSEMSLESVTFQTTMSMLKHNTLKACKLNSQQISYIVCTFHLYFVLFRISLPTTAFGFGNQGNRKQSHFLLISSSLIPM